jgi:serine protease AprX
MTRRVYPLIPAVLLVLFGASPVAAADTYVEKGLRGAGTHQVIITVTPGREAEVIDALQRRGRSVKSEHPSINGVAADINGADVADLASHGAATITADSQVHGWGKPVKSGSSSAVSLNNLTPYGPTTSTLRASLGLKIGSSDNLAAGVINGSGVGVAVIDSGIAASSDFDSRIIKWKDYVNGKPLPYDDFGHGTHIAGLIASSGGLSGYMFQGVAPKANLVVLKVLDKNGASSTSRVIAAIDYAIAHRVDLGIQVINLSLGHPITTPAKFDPLVQAVEQASRRGLIVVVAAGNDGPGYGSIDSPGNAPSAITVGAVDGMTTVTRGDDHVEYFSSRGPTWYDGFAKPDVVAPGVNLYSNAAAGSTLVKSGAYPTLPVTGSPLLLDLSGTSLAAAVATGVVALELDANAHQSNAPLTPNAAKAILEYTAIPVAKAQSVKPTALDPAGSLKPADVLMQGAGQINADGALQVAGVVNTAARTNTPWLQGVSGGSTIVSEHYTWAQNIIWGTNVLAGQFMLYNGLMWDDNIIWGTGVVKGSTLVGAQAKAKASADNIIWGTNITSHQNVVWGAEGDNIIWGTNLAQFRVIGERVGSAIVWNRAASDNIIWGTLDDDNIIWGTDDGDNIIWGTWDGDNIIWGTTDGDNIIWGTSSADDNIIWGTSAKKSILKANADDNIIWGTAGGKIVLMAKEAGDNIIWGTADSDNIIWGTSDDNIIWGTGDDDNIIWGTNDGDNIIWGTSVGGGK